MKVGEYVRTIKGIGKIEKIETDKQDTIVYLDSGITIDYITKDFTEEEINKIYPSSPKIIKLIEVGDLLKMEYYSLRYNERVTRLFEVTFKDGKYINLNNAKCEFMLVNGEFNKGDKELKPIIKSIVTKEQFEALEYKCE